MALGLILLFTGGIYTPMTPHPCIYALRHRPTGKVYIGSTNYLLVRMRNWKQAFRDGRAAHLAAVGPFDEWEPHVLQELPGATPSELARAEAEVLVRAVRKAPAKIVNKQLVARRPDAPGLEVGGRVRLLAEWERETGVSRGTVRSRLRLGWTPEQAVGLAPPPLRDQEREQRERAIAMMETKIVGDNGEFLTLGEAAEHLGVGKESLCSRLRYQRRSYGALPTINVSELRNQRITR